MYTASTRNYWDELRDVVLPQIVRSYRMADNGLIWLELPTDVWKRLWASSMQVQIEGCEIQIRAVDTADPFAWTLSGPSGLWLTPDNRWIMPDMSLRTACREAHRIAVDHGEHDYDYWYDSAYLFDSLIGMAHSDLSEALEAHRRDRDSTEQIGQKLADVVIRVMDTAEALGIDLARSVAYKMMANSRRPGRHGGLPY